MINYNENEMKKENKSHINTPRPWRGHKYIKCKKCPSMLVLVCIKQKLIKIWSSIYEKIKQHWVWLEKLHC